MVSGKDEVVHATAWTSVTSPPGKLEIGLAGYKVGDDTWIIGNQ